MKKLLRFIWPVPLFMLCAAVSVLISARLIRNMEPLLSIFASLTDMRARTVSQASEILSQLRYARLRLPWLPILACGTVFGVLSAWIIRSRKHKTAFIAALWILQLIIFIPAALWLTEVNSIRTGALLSGLLPVLSALL